MKTEKIIEMKNLELVRTIDGQIGTGTSQYTLTVKPEIYIVAKINITQADVRTIYETFAPSLTIELHACKKETPNYISMESLEHTRLGTITGTCQIFLQWVINQRLVSYLATSVTIPILAITTWFYIKTKPTTPPKKPIQRIARAGVSTHIKRLVWVRDQCHTPSIITCCLKKASDWDK